MTQQLLLDILPASPPSLDNFVTGGNEAAVDAVRALLPGRAIYLWGTAGSGRSHLLKACTHQANGQYFDAQSPVAELRNLAVGVDHTLACIAVDDVAALAPEAQAALFALYNRWRELAATPRAFALLVSGEASPLAMPLREDLRSRLGWDLVYRLEQLSDADRAAALTGQAQARGLRLSDEVLGWILAHYDRDMGRLSALVDALDRYSLSRHRSITLPLLKELLAYSAQTRNLP